MIKLHLHKIDSKEYGHLYSDSDNMDELIEAGNDLAPIAKPTGFYPVDEAINFK